MSSNSESQKLSENEFFVETILDKTRCRGKDYYLVKWAGFSVKESTWEPRENLKKSRETLQEFEAKWRREQIQKRARRPSKPSPPKVSVRAKGRSLRHVPESDSPPKPPTETRLNVSEKKPKQEQSSVAHPPTNRTESRDIVQPHPLASADVLQPAKILGVRMSKRSPGLEYAIEWNVSSTASPFRACLSTDEIARCWPRLLIDYLEEHVNMKIVL